MTNWKYCPTSDNRADLLTRDITSQQHACSETWRQGSSWPPQESRWPSWHPTKEPCPQATSFCTANNIHESCAQAMVPEQTPGLHTLIPVTNFRTLSSLVSDTAYVLRFVWNLSRQSENKGALNTQELDYARKERIKNRQQMTYHKEITSILSQSLSRTELVRQLCVSLDDTGLLSCFHNAPVTESTKFPLLLPPKDPFTELVIRDTHVHQLQAGVNSTLTSLRLGYWIPAGCQHKKKVINHCVTCKKISGSPYNIPDPPPLPKARVTQAEPFTVTGVDFTGALFICEGGVDKKVYICLFMCASTRATHLEIVTDLSVQTFLLVYRRRTKDCSSTSDF